MSIDYGKESGNFEKLPKVGEPPKEFEIKECKRIDDPEYKYNFKKREERILESGEKAMVEVNQGYRFEFYLTNGKSFSLNSWKPFFAFKEADVQDGDTIRVSHPREGEWQVEVLTRNLKENKETGITNNEKVAWND